MRGEKDDGKALGGSAPSPRWMRALGVGAASGFAHGALVWASLPPISWWFLAFLAVAPLLLAVMLASKVDRPGRVALGVMLGALPWWAVLQWWMLPITALGTFPLVAILSSFPALFVWVLARVGAQWSWLPLSLTAPILWAGLEYLRGEVAFTGYVWGFVSHPLIDVPVLARAGAWNGMYLMSWAVVVPAAVLVDIAAGWMGRGSGERRRAMLRPTVGAVLACTVVLFFVLAPEPTRGSDRSWRVGLLQTNVPQSNKASWTVEQEWNDWKRFEALVAHAAEASPKPQVLILPETMMPGTTLEPEGLRTLSREQIFFTLRDGVENRRLWATAYADRLLEIQTQLDIPMLIGEEAWEGLYVATDEQGRVRGLEYAKRFNSVYLVSRDPERGAARIWPERYDKIRLVPFGEVMPWINLWPWLERQVHDLGARGMRFDISPGSALRVFELPADGQTVRAVTPICFEASEATLCRALVVEGGRRRADVLVTVTNDGWFTWCQWARVHSLQIARWRCVELGVPMVRAANTGISAIIGPDGQVIAQGVEPVGGSGGGLVNVDGVLVGDVPLPPEDAPLTPYARLGDWSGPASCAASVVLILISIVTRLSKRTESANRR